MSTMEANPKALGPSPRSIYASTSHIKRIVSPEIKPKSGKPQETKATKTRRGWKKPKDKPKRPLSAYNLFFKDERKKILRGQVPTGASGFGGLAKFIAGRWKNLDSKTRSKYKARAIKEKNQYFAAVAMWKRGKQQQEMVQKIPSRPMESKGSYLLSMKPMGNPSMLQQAMFCHPNQNIYNAFPTGRNCQLVQNRLLPLPYENSIGNKLKDVDSSPQFVFSRQNPNVCIPFNAFNTFNTANIHLNQHSLEPLPFESPVDYKANDLDTSLLCDRSSDVNHRYESIDACPEDVCVKPTRYPRMLQQFMFSRQKQNVCTPFNAFNTNKGALIQDNLESLPIESPVDDETNAVDTSLLLDGSWDVDQRNEPIPDEVRSTDELSLHPWCSDQTSPEMKRILETFEDIDDDEEFFDWVSSIEWK